MIRLVYCKIVRWLLCLDCKCSKKGEAKIMASYKVEATHDPASFKLEVTDIKDAEGNPVDRSEVVVEVSAQGEVSVEYDDTNSQGVISFGGVGSGSVEYKVVDKDDSSDVLAVRTDGFSLVATDPASVGGVNVVIDGLTPEPE